MNIKPNLSVPLTIARYKFLLISEKIMLESPLNTFHSALGNTLKRLAPEVFEACFATKKGDSWPRPFTLYISNHHHLLSPGDPLIIELTLFNEAIAYFDHFHAALVAIGKHGLYRDLFKFNISGVWGISIHNATPIWLPHTNLYNNYKPVKADDILALECNVHTNVLHFEMVSPLYIKSNGEPQRDPPTMKILIERILQRVSQLSHTGFDHATTEFLIGHAAEVTSRDTRRTHWVEWSRTSVRQHQTMHLCGHLGRITFFNDNYNLPFIIPWLILSTWTHIGGKTAFGLGAVRVFKEATE
jgi:hypothetical protein